MRKKSAVATPDAIPPEVLELVGSPPILPTEDESLYYTMMALFADSIRPDDLITWMLVKDLADHRLEIARYRRIKAAIVAAPSRKKLEEQRSYWRDYAKDRARNLTAEAARQKELLAKEKKPTEEIDKLKADIESKLASDIAEAEATGQAQVRAWKNVAINEADYVDTFSAWIENVERIDTLLQTAEARFGATLEEIDRHIRGLGQLLREQLDKVIEGEFSEFQEAKGEPSEGGAGSRSLPNNDLAHSPSVSVPAGQMPAHSAHASATRQYSVNSTRARRLSRSSR